jgi:hypothetical protein
MDTKEVISKKIISENFFNVCITDMDDFPYCNLLSKFSKECNSIMELVTIQTKERITFSWCMLNGLTSNINGTNKSFKSVWLDKVNTKIYYPSDISKYCGISFDVIVRPKELEIYDIVDMLFIHTDNTFYDLSTTINSLNNKVRKYMVINDNKFIQNVKDDLLQNSNANTTYVKDTIIEFLQNNHSWSLVTGFDTEYAMIILKRMEDN